MSEYCVAYDCFLCSFFRVLQLQTKIAQINIEHDEALKNLLVCQCISVNVKVTRIDRQRRLEAVACR